MTELRAAVIIGSGSASFEMLRNLTEVLPVMVTPRWVRNRCQPIAIRDVLRYLVGVLGKPAALGRVFEIGGPDVVTYREMMPLYAEVAGLRRRIARPRPAALPRLSSLWVGLVTPLPADLARPLVESLLNEVVVSDRPSTRRASDQQPIRSARRSRLAAAAGGRAAGHHAGRDAELPGRTPADPMPTDPDWAGGTSCATQQTARTDTPPDALFAPIAGIGGDRGWYVTPILWSLRGLGRPGRGRRGDAAGSPPPRHLASATPSTSGGSRRSSPTDAAAPGRDEAPR